MSASTLVAGASLQDITPTVLTGLNPFGADFRAVHDPIFARALVVGDDAETCAIVALDLVEVGDTTALRGRIEEEVGIRADRVILAPSHDHNAPRIGLVPPGGKARIPTPESLVYTETVYDAIVAAVRSARAAVQPVRLGIGRDTVDVNVNREEFVGGRWTLGYNPTGPSDKTLSVVTFTALDGRPVAVLLNYAVHSTVALGVPELSGDLAGATAAHVERELGPDVVALWTSGALGDQAPRIALDEPTGDAERDSAFAFRAVAAQGALLGATAVRIANGIERPAEVAVVAGRGRVVPCPARRLEVPPGMEQAEVDTVDLTLSCIRIGPVALAGVSGEVTVPVHRAILAASPFTATLTVSNANARIGYLPADESYLRRTQAADGCPIVQGFAQASIVDGLADLFGEVLSA